MSDMYYALPHTYLFSIVCRPFIVSRSLRRLLFAKIAAQEIAVEDEQSYHSDGYARVGKVEIGAKNTNRWPATQGIQSGHVVSIIGK